MAKRYVSYKDKYNTKYGYTKGKSHSLEEISKDTGVSMKGLQQIYNKGIGAYKTNPQSVRPNVKSKEQWAMARVYSAVMGGKASNIDSAELKMEKGGLIAPNGKKSNLTPLQYKLVRTPEFKAWFGDWEKDPANASKVVDENGEPLVVYHGTSSDFNIFKIGRTGGIFFTDKKNSAERFSTGDLKRLGENPKIMQCFLNIRKHYDKNTNDEILIDKYFTDYFQDRPFISKSSQKNILKDKFNKYFMGLVFFGIVGEEPKDYLLKNGYDGIVIDADNNSKSYIVFEPNQIKLADGTNTSFNSGNDDIRFAKGGKTKSNCYNIGGEIVKSNKREIPDYLKMFLDL